MSIELNAKALLLADQCQGIGESDGWPQLLEAAAAIRRLVAELQARAQVQGEPFAWVEHHKGGDNLVWDEPGGRKSPLYTTPQPAQATQAEAQQPDNAACKSVQKRLEAQQPATPEPVKAERDQLRCAQADAVIPLIGPLLDAWENADREVMSQEPELSKQLKNINSAMEDAQPVTGEPVMDVRCEGCGYMTHHREHMGCVLAAKQHTRPAPSVPGDVVRDAERYRWLRLALADREKGVSHHFCSIRYSEELDEAIDAAMLYKAGGAA